MSRLSITSLASVLICMAGSVAAQSQKFDLPDGEGKQTVDAVCTACHQNNQILNSSGYTRKGWEELFLTMIDLSDSPEKETIAAYLSRHFPEKDARKPTLVSGNASIAFKDWKVPTLGQRSRDPVEAPDGSIWWVGQWADLVGRIDPKTGAMKEYPLPEKSKPHTVTTDAAGNVWYMGNGNATIGMLDPKTEKITVYKMPDPAAKDPHSAIFDRNGTLWFTLQNSNMVGRLIPATGEIKLATVATPNAKPYGIKLSKDGTPWVACNGSNRLLSIDPKTVALTEHPLPDPATKVRRLAFASDDTIWYVNSSQGRLGHFDPKTGKAKEWNSPSGPKSHPYAIAVIDDVVWYTESGKRPDALVRFDPKTENFQSWPIPSGGVHAGIVRHMRATKDGNLLIHQSSTNRITLVTIKGGAKTQ
jgi:virginiamycin B lyase